MNFGHTEEQQQLRKTVRQFCEAEIKPHVMEWDESQKFPEDIFRKLGELGVLGAVFPEELGGSGYSYVDYSLVMEELARVDPSIALSAAAHISLCTNHIYLAGSDEQKRRYLRPIFTCEEIWCQMFSEPGAGSDVAGLGTRAVRDGDEWVVNGQKVWTSLAHLASARMRWASG